MAVTIVVGGQYGSEGKGKIAAYIAQSADITIRTGGPNAGHTVEHEGTFFKLQSIPCGFVNPNCLLALGAGAVIDVEVLLREVEQLSIADSRLVIDPLAAIVLPQDRYQETELIRRIGSTGKGVGSAASRKAMRQPDVILARDVPELRTFIGDVAQLANTTASRGGHVLLEGTQGFGLSLHHGTYPFVTSRDTTAASICSESGISPRLVQDIVLTLRTFPIRVAGDSGPLSGELTWSDVTRLSGSDTPLIERTTVTGNIRRVGRFDLEVVERAVMINRPTHLALNFVDYLDAQNRGVLRRDDLTSSAIEFIARLSERLHVPARLLGTGPRAQDIIDLGL